MVKLVCLRNMGKIKLSDVVLATELPTDPVEKELVSLMKKNNISAEELTIDELREIVAEYLQEVLLGLKDEISG